jgi:membrane glycosyltransferase
MMPNLHDSSSDAPKPGAMAPLASSDEDGMCESEAAAQWAALAAHRGRLVGDGRPGIDGLADADAPAATRRADDERRDDRDDRDGDGPAGRAEGGERSGGSTASGRPGTWSARFAVASDDAQGAANGNVHDDAGECSAFGDVLPIDLDADLLADRADDEDLVVDIERDILRSGGGPGGGAGRGDPSSTLRVIAPHSERAETMPPIERLPMLARPWQGFWSSLRAGLVGPAARGDQQPWERAAIARRRRLLAFIALASVVATGTLAWSRAGAEHPVLQGAQVALFGLLFAWVAAGCFTAVMGFVVMLRGDRHALSARTAGNDPIPATVRTALIMPICHEDVPTVFGGLRATCESLRRAGALGAFDIFVLSDSSDPAIRAQEREAWEQLRDTLGADARLHYRCRLRRTKRKAGNVADFCRRWGRDFKYMVVLDADSVMSGDCLQTLVRLMERHPGAGILQTAPQAVGHATLHARAQQFASRVTGRLFTAGMQYWQLGEAHYWGHNAIIRVAPFMQHCALAPLPGRGALAGEILSHDFVEAALMRRAGYQVWLVPDLVGSYEQQPPDLLAELQRDRRWCQGNLQNARLIAEPGLHAVHRGMLATGAMAYASAPLWLAYVALGALLWWTGDNALFGADGRLTMGGFALWCGTLAMLVMPRILGVFAVLWRDEAAQYGGTSRLLQSAALEAGLSVLLAPLRMVAHSLFVVGALTGWKLDWKSPPREAEDVRWRDAAARFGAPSLAVAAIASAFAVADPSALVWLAPIGVPLLLAVPFTVWTASSRLGRRVRDARLLMVPEEARSPAVLRRAWDYARPALAGVFAAA